MLYDKVMRNGHEYRVFIQQGRLYDFLTGECLETGFTNDAVGYKEKMDTIGKASSMAASEFVRQARAFAELNKKEIAKKKVKDAQEKLEKAKRELDQFGDYVLKLVVSNTGSLCIVFSDSNDERQIGFIGNGGYCYLLSTEQYIHNYKIWREHGTKVDEAPVEWRGGTYELDALLLTLVRSDIYEGLIYDFENCNAEEDCEDENIKRFEHNHKPILF